VLLASFRPQQPTQPATAPPYIRGPPGPSRRGWIEAWSPAQSWLDQPPSSTRTPVPFRHSCRRPPQGGACLRTVWASPRNHLEIDWKDRTFHGAAPERRAIGPAGQVASLRPRHRRGSHGPTQGGYFVYYERSGNLLPGRNKQHQRSIDGRSGLKNRPLIEGRALCRIYLLRACPRAKQGSGHDYHMVKAKKTQTQTPPRPGGARGGPIIRLGPWARLVSPPSFAARPNPDRAVDSRTIALAFRTCWSDRAAPPKP